MLRPASMILLAILAVSADDPPRSERTSYRIDFWSSQVMDFSASGQPIQRLGFGYSAWLAADLADSLPDRRRISFTVDSARLTQGSLIPLPVDSLAGARWVGLVAPDGRLDSWTLVTDRPGAGHLRTLLWQFYPRLGENPRPGAEWTDTVTREFGEINGSVRFTLVTRYRVEGLDTVAGRAAWRLAGDIAWSQAAELQFNRGKGSMNGSGVGRGVYHVAVDDRTYLAGQQTVVSDLLLARPGADRLPVHDSSTIRVAIGP